MPPRSHTTHRKILMRASLRCRTRKIRCDMAQPRCKVCANLNRECVYQNEAPRKRYCAVMLFFLTHPCRAYAAYHQILTAGLDLPLREFMNLKGRILSFDLLLKI